MKSCVLFCEERFDKFLTPNFECPFYTALSKVSRDQTTARLHAIRKNLFKSNYTKYPVCLQPGQQLSPRERSTRLRQMAQLPPCQAVYESAYNQCIETFGA